MLDYYKIPLFLLDYIIKKYNWQSYNLNLIRAYAYTGEYTSSLIDQLKKCYGEDSQEYKNYLDKAQKQKQIEKWFNTCDFFELKLKPLKLRNKIPIQKGIDVQIAVDLVSHAYQDNYDIAVICSGDADLLESINLVKNLGKKVLVVSKVGTKEEETTLSFVMRKNADSIIDLGKLEKEDLARFTHMYKEYDPLKQPEK